MARYTKIRRELWNLSVFNALSGDAKLAYFLVATSPGQTPVGALRATMPGLAAELRWSLRRFRPAFKELVVAGLVEVDETASYVGIPDFFEQNRPENPNVLKSWIRTLELLPDCELKEQLCARLEGLARDLGESFLEAFEEAFAKPSGKGWPNQEQEQEQEQEERDSCSKATPPYPENFERFWRAYPKKRRKPDALVAWKRKASERPPIDRLLAALESHKASADWQKDSGKYIPHPKKWLMGHCWNDEVEPAQPPSAPGLDDSRQSKYAKLTAASRAAGSAQ